MHHFTGLDADAVHRLQALGKFALFESANPLGPVDELIAEAAAVA